MGREGISIYFFDGIKTRILILNEGEIKLFRGLIAQKNEAMIRLKEALKAYDEGIKKWEKNDPNI